MAVISGSNGAFEIRMASGDAVVAEHAVLCIGLQGNIDLVAAAIRDGRMECRYNTSAVKIKGAETEGRPLCLTAQTPQGIENIARSRVIARLGAIPPRKLVESFGVQFPNPTREAVS